MFELPPAMLHRDFRRFWTSMVCSGFATQMVAVAVGWHSPSTEAFDLGLIGPGVRPASPSRCPRASSRTAPATTLVFVSTRGSNRRRLLLLVTIEQTSSGSSSPRGADRRNLGPRLPAVRSLTPEIVPSDLLAGPRDALGRRSGHDHRRSRAAEAAVRDPAGDRLHRRRRVARRCCTARARRHRPNRARRPKAAALHSLVAGTDSSARHR